MLTDIHIRSASSICGADPGLAVLAQGGRPLPGSSHVRLGCSLTRPLGSVFCCAQDEGLSLNITSPGPRCTPPHGGGQGSRCRCPLIPPLLPSVHPGFFCWLSLCPCGWCLVQASITGTGIVASRPVLLLVFILFRDGPCSVSRPRLPSLPPLGLVLCRPFLRGPPRSFIDLLSPRFTFSLLASLSARQFLAGACRRGVSHALLHLRTGCRVDPTRRRAFGAENC